MKNPTQNKKPIIKYKDDKHFNNHSFLLNLLEKLTSMKLLSNNSKKIKFLITILLNSQAQMKERYVRCNQKRFRFAKQIGKAMIMTLLLNKFKEYFSKENHKTY